jgi:hypothetical protein
MGCVALRRIRMRLVRLARPRKKAERASGANTAATTKRSARASVLKTWQPVLRRSRSKNGKRKRRR